MIREKDLQEAIAECNGARNPNASTCIKLAAYYTILDHLYENKVEQVEPIRYDSGSEFSNVVYGRSYNDILPVFDELMDALMIINPKLYDNTMIRLQK